MLFTGPVPDKDGGYLTADLSDVWQYATILGGVNTDEYREKIWSLMFGRFFNTRY